MQAWQFNNHVQERVSCSPSAAIIDVEGAFVRCSTIEDKAQRCSFFTFIHTLSCNIFRTTQPRRNGGPCKAARYFGGHVRSINDDRQQARVQLWKGDKRRDHALGLTQAVSSPEHQTEDDTIPTAGQARHQPQGASADFLPVDPLVVSPDENASHSDPTTEREDECTESLEQWVARKTKEFNLTTRERPNCEDIWLQFADFQEEAVWALHGSGENNPRHSPRSRRYVWVRLYSFMQT